MQMILKVLSAIVTQPPILV
jgi:hypothetical protein